MRHRMGLEGGGSIHCFGDVWKEGRSKTDGGGQCLLDVGSRHGVCILFTFLVKYF